MAWTTTQWEELYRSNDTFSLQEAGLDKFATIKVVLTETPGPLQNLGDTIKQFWAEFSQTHPHARDEPKLGVRGLEDVSVEKSTLIVKAFETSYAAVRFKNTRTEEYNRLLHPDQIDFLDNRFLTIGAGAYVRHDDKVLLGKRAEGVARAGLIEYVPQGLADPQDKQSLENIFETTLSRELAEETGLAKNDLLERKATHLNIGPKYGDFTLIYHLIIDPRSLHSVKANPQEHQEIFWERAEALRQMQARERYGFTPVTIALFDKILK